MCRFPAHYGCGSVPQCAAWHTNNVDFAGRIVYNERGVEVFNFGKYRGMPVVEVLQRDPSYYSWMMQGDFTLNTKQVLTRIKLGTK